MVLQVEIALGGLAEQEAGRGGRNCISPNGEKIKQVRHNSTIELVRFENCTTF